MAKSKPSSDASASGGSRRRGLIGHTLGGCRIEKKLGEGGMGAVFLGRHLGLDMPVAVKVLPPSFARVSQKNIDRFLREARSAAKLQHANVIRVLNVGHEKGLYFLVMEYVEGEDLEDRLEERGVLPVDEAVEIVCQVAEGLEAARAKNIIHRDIKPENILIDGAGTAKLADLGLAKNPEEDHGTTHAGTSMGTPHYMAPEQGRDSTAADHRSDIYSLGCTFFRMLCGRVPFEGKSTYDVLHKHIHEPPPDPQALNRTLPKSVGAVIQRMMAKDPAKRYPTAGELATDLRRIQTGEPLVKKPELRPAGARRRAAGFKPRAARRPSGRTASKTRQRRAARPRKQRATGLVLAATGVAALIFLALAWKQLLPDRSPADADPHASALPPAARAPRPRRSRRC